MIKENAYAKINLYLEVLDRLPNGYHNIDSVMQTVSLCDGIGVDVKESGKTKINITCNDPDVPCDGRNTVYKAAEQFMQKIGAKAEVDIHIDKVIPMCAGLGGGSADAAAVLRGLNRIYGEKLSVFELCEIGLKVGADVPFCIKGGATVCGGVGEVFSPCEALSEEYHILIAIGKEGSPTPEAYRKIDNMKKREVHTGSGEMVQALAQGDIKKICGSLYNVFEKVVLPANNECSRIRRLMAISGADGVLMSGSGASVFGIFSDKRKYENAKKALSGVAKGIYDANCINKI